MPPPLNTPLTEVENSGLTVIDITSRMTSVATSCLYINTGGRDIILWSNTFRRYDNWTLTSSSSRASTVRHADQWTNTSSCLMPSCVSMLLCIDSRSATDWLAAHNPLNGRGVNWLHFAIQPPGLTCISNFWHSGTLALSPERQSARMSEIKNLWVRPGCHWTFLSVTIYLTPLHFKGLSCHVYRTDYSARSDGAVRRRRWHLHVHLFHSHQPGTIPKVRHFRRFRATDRKWRHGRCSWRSCRYALVPVQKIVK